MNTLELEEVLCCVCGQNQGRIVAEGTDYEYNTCSNRFTFRQCGNCGLWYLSPRPQKRDFPVLYPSNYYSYDPDDWKKRNLTNVVWDALENRKIRKILGRYIKNPQEAHVFEIGSGSGRLLRLLKGNLPPSASIWGVEISESAVLLSSQIAGVTVYHGDFEELPIEPGSLDMIFAQQLLEHIPDPRRMLLKAYQSLKPGGVFIMETPNVNGLDRKIFSRSYWGGYHFPRHMNLFSPATLSKLCVQCGYSETHYERLFSASFWITTARNIISRRPLFKGILPWVYFKNPLLLCVSTTIEAFLWLARIPSSNMQFVARK